MDVVITLRTSEPPSGTIRLDDGSPGEPRPFEGWLGMVGALYDLLGCGPAAAEIPLREAGR